MKLRSLLASTLVLASVAPAVAAPAPATLVGRAVWEADSFTAGPTSGAFLGASLVNGRRAPFEKRQPVQGFSAVLDNGDGTFLVLGDNGFGYLENSADHQLRMYTVRPRFKTAHAPAGGHIELVNAVVLHDPDRHLPFTLTHEFTSERLLTGADLDPESVQRAPDGTYWIGDEFGPFLIHVDAAGKVLEPPYGLPDPDRPGVFIRSPQNPLNEEASAIRLMNAVRADARAHGATRDPVFSPVHLLLADGDAKTRSGDRPATASSEVIDVASLRTAGHAVVPWTVNESPRMRQLLALRVDGLITDSPDRLYKAVAEFDADGDGKPGDWLTPDGLIDPARFDAQGHRGARDLRPENTLPSFESALDHLMNTLETDIAITQDGQPVLSHDPEITAYGVRRRDGRRVAPLAVRHVTLSTLQRDYIADRKRQDRPRQAADIGPVAQAFTASRGLPHPYAMPALSDLFAFVAYYEAYYREGAGRSHPRAAVRAKNAATVRFNIETKYLPRWEQAGLAPAPAPFAAAVADAIVKAGVEARSTVQSFDVRTLRAVHARYPAIRTGLLHGDAPPLGFDRYPWAVTAATAPFRARKTGGFEGMAISQDGRTLYPMLEKPLVGDDDRTLRLFAFDLGERRYTGQQWRYRLAPSSTSVPDFIMVSERQGLVIERDDRQGALDAIKRIHRLTLGAPGGEVAIEPIVDLMRLRDPEHLSFPGRPGDVGLGNPFALPYFTIEGLVKLGPNRLGVVTDNNYPFSVGRHAGSGAPDDSEFIVIEVPGGLVTE